MRSTPARPTPARLARRLTVPALTALFALAGAAVAAPAAPAALRPLPVPDGTRYCAAVVGHVPGADGRSPLLGHGCSEDSRSDALARAEGTRRSSDMRRPADRWLLLEEYRDVDFGGGVIYSFYGDAGGCDATGYHLVNYFDVALSVSSMKGYNNCNTVTLTSPLEKVETIGLPAGYLGPDFNDAVRELQVFHS
ncbi:hypothetical protein J5Y04_32735 [Kitasatospora sp. RG8]|uniref:hypothetical protein n=1 Tax=Kitasatospora sp. RG8 TaxID=2820815 RepID=UPI001AE08B90|nr:hypothetical protein [Kitasatospora sp. RG8]MBP0454266.1 hypothetical protein [Kitasatospora sp. RG8]